MQKRCEGRVDCEVVTFDSDRCRFYPKEHVIFFLRQRWVLLLSTVAGVWVGNQTDSFQPTR